jgi:predicted NBD/HSP70 family sugar kinase
MTSQHLDKRLSRIAAKVPEKPNPRAQAAFKAIITYLDELAARKAAGDPEVQAEIEMAAKALKE